MEFVKINAPRCTGRRRCWFCSNLDSVTEMRQILTRRNPLRSFFSVSILSLKWANIVSQNMFLTFLQKIIILNLEGTSFYLDIRFTFFTFAFLYRVSRTNILENSGSSNEGRLRALQIFKTVTRIMMMITIRKSFAVYWTSFSWPDSTI